MAKTKTSERMEALLAERKDVYVNMAAWAQRYLEIQTELKAIRRRARRAKMKATTAIAIGDHTDEILAR